MINININRYEQQYNLMNTNLRMLQFNLQNLHPNQQQFNIQKIKEIEFHLHGLSSLLGDLVGKKRFIILQLSSYQQTFQLPYNPNDPSQGIVNSLSNYGMYQQNFQQGGGDKSFQFGGTSESGYERRNKNGRRDCFYVKIIKRKILSISK